METNTHGYESPPKILVMGLGGIGGIVAAHLLERGIEPCLVTTNAAICDVINRNGLTIVEEGERRTIPGRAHLEAPNTPGGFDYVLLATQPTDVERAAASAKDVLGEQGSMVCFQNGLCEARVARIVGEKRVIGGVVAWGASVLGPGVYQRTSSGGFTIGRYNVERSEARDIGQDQDATCRALACLLESIGPVDITDNLAGSRWAKLAINCAISSIGTVGGDRLGVLLKYRFIRRLGLEVMTEVVEVARKEGIHLEKVAGTLDLQALALTPQEKRAQGSASLVKKHALLLAVGARYRRLRSSMLAAIERGRPPAVDYLNGEVVEAGSRLGVGTPVNAALQSMIHRIARRERSPGVDLLRSLYEETRA